MKNKYEEIWKKKKKLNLRRGDRFYAALKLVDNGERILDVGCGDGTFFSLLNNKYKELYGVDFSDYSLNLCKEKNINVFKVDLNTQKLPFKSNFFDTIICLDVIEHVIDPHFLLQEIFRTLKVNGHLILSTPNIRFLKHLFSLIVKGNFPKTSGDKELYDGGHIHYFTFRDIKRLIHQNGFKTIKVKGNFGMNILKSFLSPGIVIKCRKIKKW